MASQPDASAILAIHRLYRLQPEKRIGCFRNRFRIHPIPGIATPYHGAGYGKSRRIAGRSQCRTNRRVDGKTGEKEQETSQGFQRHPRPEIGSSLPENTRGVGRLDRSPYEGTAEANKGFEREIALER